MFPSEYEGFGAPVLEAMALGTPVVCSDRAALPEVAGDAALVRPLELDAWEGALDEVDRDAMARRRRAGARRAVHDRRVGRRARRRRTGAASTSCPRQAQAVDAVPDPGRTGRCASSCSARTSSPTPRRRVAC